MASYYYHPYRSYIFEPFRVPIDSLVVLRAVPFLFSVFGLPVLPLSMKC